MTQVQDHTPIDADIREVLKAHARLSVDALELDADADLYQAGMSSHASVNVMLALEGRFDLEFPDSMLNRAVFASIAAIRGAVLELQAA
ncbi:phosphopantetheine binding protein [Sphaerotilus hippei]|uniref:Phosphopantetheine binding protein n=1 Tax=Sphaerotilus hippei TaxID=744406 RepID=A0A318H3K1_9BURK|nr:acyl carrier protein [Sphaerotilus hippei]PXW98126.1 phosphopantetheine binding protein [Sphaerotilus hippei]